MLAFPLMRISVKEEIGNIRSFRPPILVSFSLTLILYVFQFLNSTSIVV